MHIKVRKAEPIKKATVSALDASMLGDMHFGLSYLDAII